MTHGRPRKTTKNKRTGKKLLKNNNILFEKVRIHMILRTRIIGTLLAAITLAFSSIASAKEMRLGLIVPISHAWSVAAKAMGEELKERSDGKFSVSIFPSGQLGSEAQMMQQLQTGALDMAFLTAAELTNHVTDMGALFAPYLVGDVEEAGKLLNGPTAQRLLDRLPRKTGTVGLGYGIAAMRLMLTTFPADSVESLDGRKIRVTPFAPVQDFYQILGAAPTPMPLPAVYDALANGQVDGIDADLELVWKLKLYERGDTLLYSRHMMFPVVGLISGRLWAQLGEADRALIAEVAKKHLNNLFGQYSEIEARMLKNLQGTELNVVEVGPEFFEGKLEQWDKTWSQKSSILKDLRKEAAELE
ncbi:MULTISPECIES: TRAP transporter substrate-binding protein [unclassified Marinobacter]|uniref:TRAP transporter substrate-binding protein n=1 Tax=unclassified Marinobacter TaxID=83889 RepID=UPI00200F2BA5|nr:MULTISPECIES: TRAP transporter substrate-binding protein [unclassified Marinobacter]MCL1481441.1 TRAP transporter substrate-binding protein [Marinobacter sp.]UQG54512.1 TRAP transporter substrate-binding protein [Marinobacter sp. M4C]UQG63317.1 TRAP transporter substrate-binding protein [Marinobacter sp. M2C]UQG67597.1 TRAP transporter substrate-binding protein [Marinobacter sp. M1C]